MKLILIILMAIFSKTSSKVAVTVTGFVCANYCKSQSYTSGGNIGYNSWSVYKVNSPTNTYGNRYNCVNINQDSIVLRTKYIMMDSISGYNYPMIPNAKIAWLDGRQMKISKMDSLPLSVRQITTGLGFMPSNSTVSVVNSFNTRTGSVTLTNTDVYNALGYTPYSSLNPNGYISNITFNMVTGALTYTPYNSTNPNGYISSYTPTLSLSSYSLSAGGNTVVLPSNTLTAITASTGISITNGSVITNTAPDQTVALSSANNQMTVTSSYPNFTLTPHVISTNTVTRPINSTTFQPSASFGAWVYYTIRINCTATIGSASSGTVLLQHSIDGGSTWVDDCQVENSNTVSLAVVLNSNTTQTGILASYIPIGAIVRMVSNSAGTTTISFIRGVENY